MLEVIALVLFSQQPVVPVTQGVASYYNVASSSTLTASGEPLIDTEFTFAMREGDFGAFWRVTAENGNSIICRLNDRGPYVDGRLIDLSEAAMRALDPDLEQGLLNVTIERIPEREEPQRTWERRRLHRADRANAPGGFYPAPLPF